MSGRGAGWVGKGNIGGRGYAGGRGAVGGRGPVGGIVPCPYCKLTGHTLDTCVKKKIDDQKRAAEEQKGKRGRKVWRPAVSECIPKGIPVLGGDVMIYTDVKLGDGKSLGKCLVDTGAAVNVLIAEKVRELGLTMLKSEVENVKGFDG